MHLVGFIIRMDFTLTTLTSFALILEIVKYTAVRPHVELQYDLRGDFGVERD